jgi:Mlc titration factor MtfA (ptsG expression regulator)
MAAMLFAWLRQRRRQKLLGEPLPPAWLDILRQQFVLFRHLDADQQARLIEALRIFIAEKDFEGCKGLEVTETMRLLIAAQASLLVLGMPNYYFDNVQTVLVYPEAFRVTEQHPIAADVALHGEGDRLGEAHHRGPVILSWADVSEDIGQPGYGQNLVCHEFAHQLDMLNGEMDGVPALPRALHRRWQRVMAKEYERLSTAADLGADTLIDPYGANEPAEFFAVVTEEFFDGPLELREHHPELYGLLRDYYRVEPTTWFERMGPPRDTP